MSLRDTIDAARREAQEAGSIFAGKEKEADEAAQEESSGFYRRSAARAKPTSAAASTVRVVSAEDAKLGKSGKKSSEMTKEERKAERNRVRDSEDRLSMAANILLKRDHEYARTQRVWWTLLCIGLVLSIASFGINWTVNRDGMVTENMTSLVVFAMIAMVLAYVCIIGAFIHDLIKARPIRKRVDAEVKGMTKKRIDALIREDAEEQAAKKAKK